MSDSPLRIVMIAILLIVVFAFIFIFLYLGMQGLVNKQIEATAETEVSTEDTAETEVSTEATTEVFDIATEHLIESSMSESN